MLQMLGTYRVEQKLADGGMGAVFLATAPDGRRVVLKVPHAQDRDAAIALADEARTGARLRHPAIIETLDFFVDKGRSVLVVAHIDGPSLYDLRRAGPLPGSAVAEIGVQLAGALYAIHAACDEAGRPLHMLHRDISPNNVLVDRTGQVRLIDLGIARSADRKQKATSAGMVKGTLRYLAPEILRGGDHDIGTDLWALGLTLWEAALGRYALEGDPMNTMRAAMDGSILQLGDGEHIDDDVRDAVAALVCPAAQRIKNARAAGAVLTRLANKRPGGRDALAEAVAVVGAALHEDERTDNVDITLTRDRGAFSPGSRPELPDVTALLPREEDVAGVFTSTTPRGQIAAQLPRSGRPPTQRATQPASSVPIADEGDVFSVHSSAPSAAPRPSSSSAPAPVPMPALATAPTLLQLPASQLPSTAEVHAAPTLLQMPRFASDANNVSDAKTQLAMPAVQVPSVLAPSVRVSAVGPTLLQMPAAAGPTLQMPAASPVLLPSSEDPRATEARPAKKEVRATKTEEDNLETAATIQMPVWTGVIDTPGPSVTTPRPDAPKPSLFLPIVVVDALEDEE